MHSDVIIRINSKHINDENTKIQISPSKHSGNIFLNLTHLRKIVTLIYLKLEESNLEKIQI